MKKSVLVIIILVLFAGIGYAQLLTQVVDNYDDGFKSLTVQGVLSGTDTLYTSGFKFSGTSKIFDVFAIGSQTNDSIKVKLVRQVSYFGSTFITETTIGTDSVKTQKAWADTSTYYNVLHRIAVVGVTGNGYRTNFTFKESAKREN